MTKIFKIEKGIELPSLSSKRGVERGRYGKSRDYPFKDMIIGDSFLIQEPEEIWGKARKAAALWGKRHDRKYTTRQVDGGLRVWRTE